MSCSINDSLRTACLIIVSDWMGQRSAWLRDGGEANESFETKFLLLLSMKFKNGGFRSSVTVCNSFSTFRKDVISSSSTVEGEGVVLYSRMYVVGSKSFRPDQLFKVTEIKQLCYFST